MSKSLEVIHEELAQHVSQERKQQAEHSLLRFIELYLPHHATAKMANHHKVMAQLLEQSIIPIGVSTEQVVEPKNRAITGTTAAYKEGGETPTDNSLYNIIEGNYSSRVKDNLLTDSKMKRLLFLAPRGFGKSFMCSFFFVLWLILYKKKTDIILVSATVLLSKRILRFIRQELESNEKILEDFGDMQSEKWTEDLIILKNGVQLAAKGRGFQIRGFRPDLIICDDLEDEETIYSSEQREKTEHWFFRTLIPTLKPGQGLVYVGTKLHQFSLIAKLEERKEFRTEFFAALVEGKSIWEEQWPTQRLNELRESMGEYAFQAEYMNNPISLEDQPIKPDMIDGVKIEGKLVNSVLAIDPAISMKESSDPRAFVLMGQYRDKNGQITGFKEIHSESGIWSIEEQLDRIMRIAVAYEPNTIVVEQVAFQKIFAVNLMKRMRDEGIFIPVRQAELGMGRNKRPKDKFTRLMEIVHLFEQRLVEIRSDDLRKELLSFPHGDHDDLTDACVFALYPIMRDAKGKALAKRSLQGHSLDAKKAWVFKELRPGVWGSSPGDPPPPKVGGGRILSIGRK